MNISTYEARIKSLEDQLNPPGPPVDHRTGIQSVVITPDVAGSNAKLAAMMPIAPVPFSSDVEALVLENITDEVDSNTDYTITVTPGTDYYASNANRGTTITGEPLTYVVHGHDYIDTSVTATDVSMSSGSMPTMICKLDILIGNIQ